MTEKIFFNEFGLTFIPDELERDGNEKARTAMILPSLFEEYRCSHRIIYELCHALSKAGVIALFPKLTGLGNDDEFLAAANMDVWRGELERANDFLSQRSTFHTIIPFRIGALFTSGLCADRFIFWHPALSGQKFLRQLRVRREIQNKITGDIVLLEEGDLEGQIASRQLRDDLTDYIFTLPKKGEIIITQQSAGAVLFSEYAQLVNENPDRNIHTNVMMADSYWYPHSPTDYSAVISHLVNEVTK